MATVYIQRRKCKSFYSYAIKYKDPVTSQTKHYKTFRKRREAVYASHELRMMIDHGKLYEIPKRKYQLNVLTFARTAQLTEQAWRVRLKKGSLRQTTYDGYCIRLDLLKRKFGKRMLWDIQKEDIEEYLERLTPFISHRLCR